MPKPVVGQKLWWVPFSRRFPPAASFQVTVSRVGRRWFAIKELPRLSFAVEEWDGVGACSVEYGRLWPSKDVAEAYDAASAAWVSLRSKIAVVPILPEGLTLDSIKQASALLFPEVTK